MKTKNNAQETVKGQVKMMVLRGSAVIFSLVLISLTLSAQDFWKQFLTNSTSGKMVLMMVEQSSETEKVDAIFDAIDAELTAQTNISTETFVCETEVEEELEVEAWMTNETYFTANASLITEETDEALNLEDWMISNSNFNNQEVSITVDAEPAPEVEAWMTDETYFGANASLITEEDEEALNLEDWMISNINFSNQNALYAVDAEPALEVEAWMTTENFYNTTEGLFARDADLEIQDWMLKSKYFSNRIKLVNEYSEFNAWKTGNRFRGF